MSNVNSIENNGFEKIHIIDTTNTKAFYFYTFVGYLPICVLSSPWVRELFNTYATTGSCSHLTLGLKQNSNESLHNMIWCLCSKNKYLSPQSIRISTDIAVLSFNEGELSLFVVMCDLGLSPSQQAYYSIVNREHKLQYSGTSKIESNFQRRRRRMKLDKQHREKALLKSEGGGSYRGGRFRAESIQRKMRGQTRGRVGQARRVSIGMKRKVKERSTPFRSSQSSGDVQMSRAHYAPFAIREIRTQ